MAAKLQCYHTWLFYYLYSADYKFIKAIFKLKFEFVKVLFAGDFSTIFEPKRHQSASILSRKHKALDMLRLIYFPDDRQKGQNVYTQP